MQLSLYAGLESLGIWNRKGSHFFVCLAHTFTHTHTLPMLEGNLESVSKTFLSSSPSPHLHLYLCTKLKCVCSNMFFLHYA